MKKKNMEEAKQKQAWARKAKKQQKEVEQRIKALNPWPRLRYGKNTQQELPALHQVQMVFKSQIEAGVQ